MKQLSIIAASAAMLLAGATTALAQDNPPVLSKVAIPVGRVIICAVNVGAANVTFNDADVPGDLLENEITGSGSASFESISTTSAPVNKTEFKPVTLSFTGNDPTYGDFTFEFDASRPPTTSTVTANQPGADFPATAHIYANVKGTVGAQPGQYTNRTECHISTSNLQSFNPQLGETYTFENDVTFTSDAEGAIPITIKAGSTVIMN